MGCPSYLGWRRNEFTRVAKQRGLTLGGWTDTPERTWMRYPPTRTWLSRSRLDWLLMIHQAAPHLEMRETDFRYLLAADLIAPTRL